MDIASLIKTIADRASLLFGATVAGAVFFYASHTGLITDVNPMFLHSVYWVAALAGSALAFGVISWLYMWITLPVRNFWQWRKQAKFALRNFSLMLPAHRATLLFLKANGLQRFPLPHPSRTLSEMANLGLLEREYGNSFHADTVHYSVPRVIWRNMEAINWPGNEIVPNDPPWHEADYRRI